MDKVFLFSDKTFCCAEENNEDSDVFKAKFVVSDFSTNRNSCKLNRKTIVNWMNTLVNKPLVGKLTSSYSGESDFTGHNLKTVVKEDEDGNRYKTTEFDTQAFGVFTDVGIEKINDDECIVASCDIWKRFPKACEVIMKRIEDGVLNTSWEIGISESHKVMENGVPVKIIDNGTFLGHCLLGKNVTPAYDCSRALEIAEADEQPDDELSDAYAQDVNLFKNIDSDEKEEASLKKKKDSIEAEAAVTEVPTESAVDETKPESDSASSPDDVIEASADTDEGEDEEEDKAKDSDSSDEPKDNSKEETDGSKKEDEEDAETSEASSKVEQEAEVSAMMTDHDLFRSIQIALDAKRVQGWIEFNFPLDKTIWVKESGNPKAKALDYLVFTYEVDTDGNVILSEPMPATLAVEFKNINTRFADLTNAIAEANTKLNKKDEEIASLMPYKEQVEKAEADRLAAEKAEKVEALRKYAIDSKLISEAEVSEGGELADMVNELNESGIKTIIAERYMAGCNKVETSTRTIETSSSHENIQRNLSDSQDEIAEDKKYRKAMNSYLNYKREY